MGKIYFHILLFLFFTQIAFSQNEENYPDLDVQLIEDILQGNEDLDVSDLVFVFESLQGFLRSPLNLNSASLSDLEDLFLLNQYQIQEFFRYKRKAGELISIYELQETE